METFVESINAYNSFGTDLMRCHVVVKLRMRTRAERGNPYTFSALLV
jgi:hypothetical protein